MSIAAFGVVLLLAVPGAPLAPATHSYWIQATPEGASEKMLRDAVEESAGASATALGRALAQVSESQPGTVASGLARLATGLALADEGRGADALAQLTHPDVAKTAVADYASLTLARLTEAQDPRAAAAAYEALLVAYPETPLACTALTSGAADYEKAGLPAKALPLLERALTACAGSEPRVLLATGRCQEQTRALTAAASTYDRLAHDYPIAPEAQEAERRVRVLANYLPAEAPGVREARDLKRALALFDAGKFATAAPLFRTLQVELDSPRARKAAAAAAAESGEEDDTPDLVRVRLGRCLAELRRWKDAEAQLRAVPATSPLAAEAAFFLAKRDAQRRDRITAYEDVAKRYKGTPWAEEALAAMGAFHLKDALVMEAVPYYRQIVDEYPEGKYFDRASWWVGLGEFRAGHYEEAAVILERAARRPPSSMTAGFLFWAGLARMGQGETARSRALLEETVRRYKYAYHGRRAAQTLARLPPSTAAAVPSLRALRPDPSAEIPPARLQRVRQLLLVDRLEEAAEELKNQPATSASQATIAWIHSRRGRLRLAINAMKRAYPEYIGEGGDLLPIEVLRILYPIDFKETLEKNANAQKLDPALVAALVCQESTFDPGAYSSAGARGLMQIIPATGRTLARSIGVRFRAQSLHNPEVSLEFGTRYLREMIDRFGGRVERALAAYNAGPHRVDAWTATRPEVTADEFAETIPFTETRGYVMSILSMTERYRQIYGFAAAPPPQTGS